MNGAWWSVRPGRPGLAGGIDNDGSRAVELLAAGFGSVEFGTVTPRPEAGHNPGAAALAARLAALAPHPAALAPGAGGAASIGIGIGCCGDAAPRALAAEWLAGLAQAWQAADYLSFNLSARRYRALLDAAHWPLLLRALGAVAAERNARCAGGGRRVGIALKLPLGPDGALPLDLAEAAADCGFDAVTAVLPGCGARLERLAALAPRLRGKAALIAVGGIRNGADVRAALACGADGVQVHTVFAQLGAACLAQLLAS